MPRICQKCEQRDAVPKEKYCIDCKVKVLKELQESGYLTTYPFRKQNDCTG